MAGDRQDAVGEHVVAGREVGATGRRAVRKHRDDDSRLRQGVLRLGSTPTYGLILPDGQDPARPIKVTVPTAASLTSAQRASRNVPGVSFSAGLQGAIETTTVQGTLVP